MNQIVLHVIILRGYAILENIFVNIKLNAFEKQKIEINGL